MDVLVIALAIFAAYMAVRNRVRIRAIESFIYDDDCDESCQQWTEDHLGGD